MFLLGEYLTEEVLKIKDELFYPNLLSILFIQIYLFSLGFFRIINKNSNVMTRDYIYYKSESFTIKLWVKKFYIDFIEALLLGIYNMAILKIFTGFIYRLDYQITSADKFTLYYISNIIILNLRIFINDF
jgi:uncharacterized membrane protein YvlD (DUF360 family)